MFYKDAFNLYFLTVLNFLKFPLDSFVEVLCCLFWILHFLFCLRNIFF